MIAASQAPSLPQKFPMLQPHLQIRNSKRKKVRKSWSRLIRRLKWGSYNSTKMKSSSSSIDWNRGTRWWWLSRLALSSKDKIKCMKLKSFKPRKRLLIWRLRNKRKLLRIKLNSNCQNCKSMALFKFWVWSTSRIKRERMFLLTS